MSGAPEWLLKGQKIVSSPVYATLTTVLAVIAGLLGSVYQDDIANAFPLALSNAWGTISWRAAAFWMSVVLFAVLFFFRQWWDDVNRERLNATALRAEQGTERIEALVRTMPPRAFQGQLAQMVAGAYRGVARVLPRKKEADLTRDDLVALIRVLLNSMARLAMIYDDQPLTPEGSAVYSANVMLFVPSPEEGAFDAETVVALRFHPAEYDLKQLLGVLVLRPELSATSDIADLPGPDAVVSAIALPVPALHTKDGRWNALPGAPKAFLTEEVDGYDDATTLGEWCTKSGNFLPSVVDELRQYFTTGDGRRIRSFISRPLLTLDGRKLGVLNLHSSRTDILGDTDERMPAFLAMLTPLLLELQAAVEILCEHDHSDPS